MFFTEAQQNRHAAERVLMLPEEAKHPAFNTTCTTALPKHPGEYETDKPQISINTSTAPKSNFNPKLVQMTLSIWLLRSKIHRKEFRRKAQ